MNLLTFQHFFFLEDVKFWNEFLFLQSQQCHAGTITPMTSSNLNTSQRTHLQRWLMYKFRDLTFRGLIKPIVVILFLQPYVIVLKEKSSYLCVKARGKVLGEWLSRDEPPTDCYTVSRHLSDVLCTFAFSPTNSSVAAPGTMCGGVSYALIPDSHH